MNFSAWSLEDENLTIRKVPFYNDEPRIFQYVADLSSLQEPDVQFRGYGSDFRKEAAQLKAAVEAIERRSLAGLGRGHLKKGKTKDLDLPFVPPLDLQHFTPEQLNSPRFDRMRVHKDSEFRWIRATNALNEEAVYLPAQAVIFPYPAGEEEPILRFPSTNGAASGRSIAEARCRAVFEIIERDSFMCWYLTAVPAKRLDIRKSGFSPDLADIFERYQLELQLLLLPSQWLEYPVILAVIIDPTGVGPCLTAGLKCHPCLQTAVMGAVAEAQQKRPWLRDQMWLYGLPDPGERQGVCDFWDRAFFWSAPGRNKEISFLWEESGVLTLEKSNKKRPANDNLDWNGMWSTIVDTAGDKGFDLFIVDINGPSNGDHGISTVKIVIPQTHPVYMDESFQYLRSVSINQARDTFGPRWEQSSDNPVNPDIPPHFFC